MKNINKTLSLLSTRRLKQAPILVLLMIVGACLEVMGVGLIIPIVEIITSGKYNDVIFSSIFFEDKGKNERLIFILSAFGILYLIKSIFLSFLAFMVGRYIYGTKADISNSLMRSYISQPFQFHLENNTAQLIRNISTEANALVQYVLGPTLTIASEIFVVIFLSIFLFFTEPLVTLTIFIFGTVFVLIFQKVISVNSKKFGKIRQIADGFVVQRAQEALGGIKDVKVYGKENFFFEKFQKQNNSSCVASGRQYFLNQLPRIYLEAIGVISMVFLLFLLTLTKDELNQTLPIAAAFGLAAYRLLPSTNRILTSINSLRFAEPIIVSFFSQFRHFANVEAELVAGKKENFFLEFNNTIVIKKVSFQYPNTKTQSLININLLINKGESIGIIGKSGAGKSTLSNLILGLLIPSSGNVFADGIDVITNLCAWKKNIAYVPQDIFLIDDSIKRNIAFGISDELIEENLINKAIQDSQLSDFLSSLPDGVQTIIGERGIRLSGGQKQRIGIARALYRDSSILIFDEATSSLDNNTEEEIISSIKKLKRSRTIIVIAHRLSTIEHCDRIVEIKNGILTEVSKNNNNA